jgi:hypothetical protein
MQELIAQGCSVLKKLPTLSSTAVMKLDCRGCINLASSSLPDLPGSLVEWDLGGCRKLVRLPALPQGLKRLSVEKCGALVEVSSTSCITG